VSPARRVLGYLRPYAARYGAGVGCLALATGLSLGSVAVLALELFAIGVKLMTFLSS
jgi:hypothetical protein